MPRIDPVVTEPCTLPIASTWPHCSLRVVLSRHGAVIVTGIDAKITIKSICHNRHDCHDILREVHARMKRIWGLEKLKMKSLARKGVSILFCRDSRDREQNTKQSPSYPRPDTSISLSGQLGTVGTGRRPSFGRQSKPPLLIRPSEASRDGTGGTAFSGPRESFPVGNQARKAAREFPARREPPSWSPCRPLAGRRRMPEAALASVRACGSCQGPPRPECRQHGRWRLSSTQSHREAHSATGRPPQPRFGGGTVMEPQP